MYLVVTLLDISYSVGILSQFVTAPRKEHMLVVERVVAYLKWTIGQGLLLMLDGNVSLLAFYNVDYGGCPTMRHSRISYFVSLRGSLISWQSKK